MGYTGAVGMMLMDEMHWGQRGCYPAGKLRVF